MFDLEVLVFLQIMMIALLIIMLKKMLQMKKQVDDVIKEIQNYITFVTEDEEDSLIEGNTSIKKEAVVNTKENRDELQNKLIQSVLGEYFV